MHAPHDRQPPGGGEIGRDRDHRGLWPLARDPQRGRARKGPAYDGGKIERLGDLACSRRDGVGAGRLRLGALGMDDAAVKRIVLHLLGDAVHGGDRFGRILAGRGFGRQHHGIGALEDRGGDVGHLGAGRHRAQDHRFEHLGRHHHWLAGAAGGARHLLLDAWHLFERHFDAEVAACDHQRVSQVENIGQAAYRLRLLNLRHHAGAAAGDLLRLRDVVGPLNERQPDPVGAGFERGVEIGAVLVRQRGERHQRVGQAHALAVR